MRVFSFLLIFMSTVVFANESSTASDHYEKALQGFAKQKHEYSERELLKAIELNPKHLPSRILIADIYLQLKKPLKAIKHLEIALDSNGDNAVVRPMLAEAKVMIGRNKDALKILSSESYKKTTRYYSALGNIYIADNKLSKAEGVFITGMDLAKGDKTGLVLGLAEVYFSQKRFDEVKSIVSKIPQEDIKYNKARMLLAESYYRTGNLSKSRELYATLYKSDKKPIGAVYGYISVLIASNLNEDAGNVIKEELKLHKSDIYLMLLYATHITSMQEKNLTKETKGMVLDLEYKLSMVSITQDNERHIFKLKGIAAFLKQDYQTAKKYLKFYVEYDREDKGEGEISYLLSKIYFNDGRYEQAKTYIRYAYDKMSSDYRIVILYAQIERTLTEYKSSLELLQGIYNKMPSNLEVKNALVVELIQQKQHEEALLLATRDTYEDLTPSTLISVGYAQLEINLVKNALETADYLASKYGLNPIIAQFVGEVSLKIGKEKDAFDFFTSASKKQESFKAPLFSLAGMHLNKNEHLEASGYYQRILTIDPEDTLALQLSADAFLKLNDVDKAIKRLELVNKLLPDDINANRTLVELYIKTKKYDLASALLRKLMSSSRVDPLLLYSKVKLSRRQGDFKSTIENLGVLFGLFYKKPIELLRIANIYSNIKANDELQKTIDRLKDFDSYDYEIIVLEAKYYRNMKDYVTALKFTDKALAINNHQYVQLLKAHILIEMKNYDSFIAYLESIDNGLNEDVFKLLLRGYSLKQNNKEKTALLERWVDKNPNSVGYISLLALEYEKYSLEKAVDLYKETLNRIPVAEFAYKLSYLDKGNSLSYSKKALTLESGNHLYMDRYGWELIDGGDYRSGLGYIREALARQRGVSLYHYHAAFALYKLERYAEAQSIINNLDLSDVNDNLKNKINQLLEKLNELTKGPK